MESSRVTLYYMPSDGKTWVDYISAKLKAYSINCDLCNFTAEPKSDLQISKVNVCFVTPELLEYPNWQTLKAVKSSSCVMVLTGTEHNDLEIVLSQKARDIKDFYVHEMEQTEESVQDLLVLIISKYEEEDVPNPPRPLIKHAASFSGDYARPGSEIAEEEDEDGPYHTLPPARQVNSLHDVLYKDGYLYILLQRRAEGNVHVQIQGKITAPSCANYGVYEVPYEGNISTEVSVLHEGSLIGKSFLNISQDSDTEQSDYINMKNPIICALKTYKDTLVRTASVETQTDETELWYENADSCQKRSRDTTYAHIDDVFEDRPSKSRTKSKLEQIREILEDQTDPEEILCQCLGIETGLKNLDNKMTSMIQRLTALRRLSYSSRQQRQGTEDSTWPTLVHFGAEFNLQNFCDVLLSNPLMWDACVITNKDGKMPHEIASAKGHKDLAVMLQRFTEFVRKERERDSGISGFSAGSTRISLISMISEPPAPHRTSVSSGYVNIDPSDDEYDFTVQSSSQNYLDMSGVHGMINSEESDRQTINTTVNADRESANQYHRKDINKFMGINDQQTSVSPEDSKKKKMSKTKSSPFFWKKGRSQSEPVVTVEGMIKLRDKGKQDSPRSSSTSSASTISDTSVSKDEIAETKPRKIKMTFFGKKKTKGAVKDAKRRASVRIKYALDDHHAELPSLPSRCDAQGLTSFQPQYVIKHDPNEHF